MQSDHQTHQFYKITALWAASECFLGGLLHGLRLPMTGLLLGSLAVVFSAMIAYHLNRKLILKATLLVLIIKAAISPHTPLGAYIAVSFQGLAAYLLLADLRFFKLGVFLLAVLVMMQSAFQKFIMLTLVYGMGVWEALDEFLLYVGSKIWLAEINLLHWGMGLYLGIYLLMGIVVGIWAARHIPKIKLKTFEAFSAQEEVKMPIKKNRKRKHFWLISWVVLAALYLLDVFVFDLGIFSGVLIKMLIRGVFVLGLWYLLLGPLLLRLLQRFLKNSANRLSNELSIVMGLLPALTSELSQLWQQTNSVSRWMRPFVFIRILPKVFL